MAPRDGSNIYSQPDPDVVADTTIESAKYNNFTNDVAQDLNLPRPIVAGGTGATNAADAIVNLNGEKALQVVTNYDSFPFVSGSFYSSPGATSEPVAGHYFCGICYTLGVNPGATTVLEARDMSVSPPVKYIRFRIAAGAWGAWFGDTSDKVAKAGDTMTGDLTINKLDGMLTFNQADDPDQYGRVRFRKGNLTRWELAGAWGSESGGNVGSNLSLDRYDNAGVFIDSPFTLTRSTGNALFGSQLNVTGNLVTNNNVYSGVSSTTVGYYYFGSNGTKYLTYDGINKFVLAGGDFQTDGFVYTIGFRCRSGVTGSFGGNAFNIFHGTGQQLYIDNTNVGTFAYTSDYRTKKNVTDLSGTWNAVKALRPIKYTHQDFTPPSEKNTSEPFMKGDDIEHWGFFAHELQETLVKSASSGVKDSPDTIQSPNPWTVIAALTKALQEAMTRIEALEAK